MGLLDGFSSRIAKANETLAAAQKTWRDDDLSAREGAVGAREATMREVELDVSNKLAEIRDLEAKRRFRKTKYALVSAASGSAGLFFGAMFAGSSISYTGPTEPTLTPDTQDTNAAIKVPAPPSSLSAAIADSDDYEAHGEVFLVAANQLINAGRCSVADFVEMGGWVKSTTTYAAEPVYFTYCGDRPGVEGRIYVDAATGDIFT